MLIVELNLCNVFGDTLYIVESIFQFFSTLPHDCIAWFYLITIKAMLFFTGWLSVHPANKDLEHSVNYSSGDGKSSGEGFPSTPRFRTRGKLSLSLQLNLLFLNLNFHITFFSCIITCRTKQIIFSIKNN